jgi:hypothetical protein
MILHKQKKIALIHVAKKAVDITDEDYRSLLFGAAGIESLTELEHEDQFLNIMEAFKNLGFISTKMLNKSRPQWTDTWGCTSAQRAKIEVMWRTCARDKSDKALKRFIKRIALVDSPRFLTVGLARKVILALDKMMIKEGFDPQTGGRIVRGTI